MHRIFKENSDINNNIINIEGDEFHHLKNVLRIKNNEKIEIIIGDNLYICEIAEINKYNIYAKIIDISNLNNEKLEITLFQSLTKSDKFEHIIQKSIELGVYSIVPIITKRVVVKLKDKNTEKKQLRYDNISKHAASQSKRNYIPKITNPINIKDITLECDEFGLVAYENSYIDLKKTLQKNTSKKIKIVIGPEGGFEEEEILQLKDKGFNIISLGDRILRTETAPVNLLSILQYELG